MRVQIKHWTGESSVPTRAIFPTNKSKANLQTSQGDAFYSRAFVKAVFEVGEHVITGAHGEGEDRHSGGFIGADGKDAGIANIKIRDVVSLRPFVGH